VYPAGTYLVVYNIEQKSQRFVPISDGDGITCISLNHNCGYAAVAVKGDRPAVIVCDMHALKKRKIFQAPEGIQAKEFINVAFSNDGKYVFAQSNGPDWSIYYWSWDKAKLVGSFKSTNNVNSEIHQMSLDPYDSAPHLCVTGSSVFRLFRYVEGGIKLIAHQKSDRNLLTHSWVSDMRVVVGTEDAKLLIFEGGDLVAEVTYTMAYNPNVVPALRSVVAYSGGLIVGTSVGTCVLFERVDEVSAGAGTGTGLYKAHKEFLLEDSIEVSAIALSPSEDSAVCTLVNSQIYVIPLDADASRGEEIKCERLCQPFHTGSIVGLDTCARKPLIATCGTDRTVRIWNYVENAIEVVKYFDDEPQSIAIHPSGLYVLVGFKEALKLMNVLIDDIRPFWTSNIRGCRECRFSNGGQYFASVYGSTVGIHSTWSFDTICNLKGHSGKVRSICWSQDDSHLITCGLDGCIYEWNVRTTRKESEVVSRNPGAPSTAGPAPGAILYTSASYSPDPKIIYAVSSDCMLREISDSHILREIPTKVQYTHLVQSRSGKMFAATSRGAVRALKYPIPAEPQTSDYVEHVCHSTAITRMRLSFDEQYLFTVADDGCVWIYRVQEKEVRGTKREKDWSYSDEILVTKSDLKDNVRLMNELRQRVEDLRSDNETQLRLKDLNYTEKLRELTEKYVTEIEALKQTTLSLKHEREKNQTTHQKELSKTKTQNHIEIKELEQNFSAKMEAEAEKYSELQKRTSVLQSQWESQMELMEIEHRDRVGQMTAYFQEKLQEKQNQITDVN
ncbi:WD40-repeat-containing domain protein, partial [Cladochytrium replicatum]